MKKIIALFCAFAVAMTATFASAASKKATNTLSVGQFSKIDIGTGLNVTFRQGAYTPIKIIGPSEALSRISVSTRGHELKIKYKKGSNGNNLGEVKIEIQAPDVRGFDIGTGASLSIPSGISTSGNMEIDLSTGAIATISGIRAADLDLDLSTGAVATVTKVNAGQVDIDASTGAQVTVSGKCSCLEADASTGAIINAGKLVSATAKIDASIGAQVDYNSRNTLKVSTSIGAEVTNHYK